MESDAELYIENLTQIAITPNHPNLLRLSITEERHVRAARIAMAQLFLRLALKLEAGVKPNTVTSHAK